MDALDLHCIDLASNPGTYKVTTRTITDPDRPDTVSATTTFLITTTGSDGVVLVTERINGELVDREQLLLLETPVVIGRADLHVSDSEDDPGFSVDPFLPSTFIEVGRFLAFQFQDSGVVRHVPFPIAGIQKVA